MGGAELNRVLLTKNILTFASAVSAFAPARTLMSELALRLRRKRKGDRVRVIDVPIPHRR